MGDAMQRGGGNMAKALAEIAECGNASGLTCAASAPGLWPRHHRRKRMGLRCANVVGQRRPPCPSCMNARRRVKKNV